MGWRWLLELVKLHDVVLVTHIFFKEHIEPELSKSPIAGLEIHYFAAPDFGLHPHTQLNSRLFYIWWQWKLRALVKTLIQSRPFDLIHHLTWGTFRFPTFLGKLGVPLVMGPLGGGDVAPLRLYKGLPFRARAFELIRCWSLYLARFDPLATWGPYTSSLVLCKTEDTILALPSFLRKRAALSFEIGSPSIELFQRIERPMESSPFKLLFAGTLTGVKGIVLAIGALQLLVKAGYDVTLDIAGKGYLYSHILDVAERLNVRDRIRMLGMLPREELLHLYGEADLFVFPSLHDSSGNVVLEALSRGLPVICLDLCGPKYYVTSECGVVVSTDGKSTKEVEQGLANAISEIIISPDKLEKMSNAALQHARTQTWESRVVFAYSLIAERIMWKN